MRSISYVKGLNYFMGNQRVPFKGFQAFVEKFSAGVRRRAEVIAKRAGRPFLYLAASRTDKEKLVREVMVAEIYPGLCRHAVEQFSAPPRCCVFWGGGPTRVSTGKSAVAWNGGWKGCA